MSIHFDSTVRIADVIGVLWTRKWIILAVTVVSVVLGLAWSSRIPREYRATASVLFSTEPGSISQPVPQATVDCFATPGLFKSVAAQKSIGVTARQLGSIVSVSPDSMTPGAVVSARTTDPQLAVRLANAVAAQGLRVYKKTDTLHQALAAVAVSRRKIATIDGALREISSSAGASSNPAAVAGTTLLRLQRVDAQAQLAAARTELCGVRPSSVTPAASSQLASPSRTTIVLWALLIGLVSGVLLAVGLDQLRRSKDIKIG